MSPQFHKVANYRPIYITPVLSKLFERLVAVRLGRFMERCGVLPIIIIKKAGQCKAGRGKLTPYQSEDPNPTLPTHRGKEEKGKIVEDEKEESN